MSVTNVVIGLDCGRGNVTACVLNAPIEDLKAYARSYKPLVFQSNRSDLETLANLGDIFALEPTGADHRIFSEFLQRQGKTVVFCKGERIRNHARGRGLTNKKDREDAAAIADYCLRALANPSDFPNAFLDLAGEEIREARNRLRSINTAKSPMQNQLWANLAYELPEFLYTDTGSKRRFTVRKWLVKEPAQTLRWLAGELEYPRFDEQLRETIGRGISPISQTLAQQICALERQEYQIEQQLEDLLAKIPAWYHAAFDRWALSPRMRAEFLSSCFPFEKFLGDDGLPVREYVPAATDKAKNEKTFRDRSLKRFMLQMGMGRVIAESGKSKGEWVMGGSKATRCALYLFVKSCVQFTLEAHSKPKRKKGEEMKDYKARLKQEAWQPFREWLPEIAEELRIPKVNAWDNSAIVQAVVERNQTVEGIAKLQVYYLLSPTCQNLKDEQRIMKISSRFVRELYRELLRQYKAARLS